MLKTDAIKKFLHQQPYSLTCLYTKEMEVQVNVAQDKGEITTGIYADKQWHGYTDGLTTWKSFRIPWEAKSNPNYFDKPITFDISLHAEAIGMTGWNYVQKRSQWVGFDFDSITSHKVGLTNEELQHIEDKLKAVSFVSLYTSTSGNGLHVYVFISSNQEVKTHTEHANIAKAILNQLAILTGINLQAKVDAIGGNMWVWHRKCNNESFVCIKKGTTLEKIPEITKIDKSLDFVTASQQYVTLDTVHIKLLKYLEENNCLYWWDTERNMLVCHTFDLKQAHKTLNFVGFFDTIATGKDHGKDKNCFCYPNTKGGWILRRFTRGTKEHDVWYRDSSGWTTCSFNKLPSLRTASTLMGGIEGEKAYYYKSLKEAIESLQLMGLTCKVPNDFLLRNAEIKESGTKVILEFPFQEGDNLQGFLHKNKKWQKLFSVPQILDEVDLPDNLVRHVVINEVAIGWFVYSNSWTLEPRHNVTSCLVASGVTKNKLDLVLGKCTLCPWEIVCEPFESKYLSKRRWNKDAPQLRYTPCKGNHPTWDLVLNHIGKTLNIPIKENYSKIGTGYLYLLSWIAALFQEPKEPLPYLVLWGKQNTGKSIFWEALSLLITKGVIRADSALLYNFNAELENKVLCVIEEVDLSTGRAAERVKDWVTGRTISIHGKGRTPFDIINHTHWIQCTNYPNFVPVFQGDTRIVMIEVRKLMKDIPKSDLLEMLQKEAAEFLYRILNFNLPEKTGRLRIPVVSTESKIMQMESNISPLEAFLGETMHEIDGQATLLANVYSKFTNWLDPEDAALWNFRRFGKELLMLGLVKGKYGKGNNMHLANYSLTEKVETKRLVYCKGRLI